MLQTFSRFFLITVTTVLVLMVGVFATVSVTHATSSDPYVHVATSTNGVSVSIDNPPNNTSEQVISTFQNGRWHTYATSSALSQTDIKNMNEQFAAEQRQMNQLFADEQKLFAEQQKMFDHLFSSNPW